jgi:hypothetical protein
VKCKSPSLCLGLIVACICLFGMKAVAQEPLDWTRARTFDTGEQTSVSIARNSNYIVEFHKSENTNKMWYHVGRLIAQWPSGYVVSWGKSHEMDIKVEWPSVTVTKEGYVIVVNSPYGQVVNQIMYWVGKINIGGSEDQDIQWYVKQQDFGYGFHPSVAVNSSGQIALVYECRNGCIPELDYRLGHLENPAAGKFNIVWDTGKDAIHYDRGINPHISINDSGQVIEVHQVAAKEYLLHYRRGTLSSTSINFQPSVRYDNEGKQPAVTLTNSGKVIELHTHQYNTAVFSRTGNLNANDPSRVDWSSSVDIGSIRFNIYPAVTTNNVEAVATWNAGSDPFGSPGHLQYNHAPVR